MISDSQSTSGRNIQGTTSRAIVAATPVAATVRRRVTLAIRAPSAKTPT